MAIIHQATVTPSKAELAEGWLDRQPWGGKGEVEVLGAYRFDDPEGAVGVEALIVRRGPSLFQVPMTYRGAELEGAEAHLVGTMDHSVLGPRWIYEAGHDPVALACFDRALSGEQEQATLELYDGGELVARREPSVRIERRVDDAASAGDLRLATTLEETLHGRDTLVATWDGGEAVVAAR